MPGEPSNAGTPEAVCADGVPNCARMVGGGRVFAKTPILTWPGFALVDIFVAVARPRAGLTGLPANSREGHVPQQGKLQAAGTCGGRLHTTHGTWAPECGRKHESRTNCKTRKVRKGVWFSWQTIWYLYTPFQYCGLQNNRLKDDEKIPENLFRGRKDAQKTVKRSFCARKSRRKIFLPGLSGEKSVFLPFEKSFRGLFPTDEGILILGEISLSAV